MSFERSSGLGLMLGSALVTATIACFPCTLWADPYTPTQVDMLSMVVGFGAGTIQSIVPDGTGVKFTATLGDEGSFSRFVPQKGNFNQDISAFTSFDMTMTNLSSEISGTKIYIQTGAGFSFFENAFVSLPVGVPTLVSLDLVGIPDLNNVRQYGWQAFGGDGTFPNTMLRVTPIPEPAMSALLGAALIGLAARWRRSGK